MGLLLALPVGSALLACAEGAGPPTTPGRSSESEPSGEDPCPVLTANARSERSGAGPSLVGEDVSADLEGLRAALPEAAAAWSLRSAQPWRRGEAGHGSPLVLATYAQANPEGEETQIMVEIDDLVHVCRCLPGMGEQLRARARGEAPGEERSLGGHPAWLRRAPRPELFIWVNDRCAAQLRGAAAAEPLIELAEAFDWPAIARACPHR